ncbi:MAG: hypothetical protein KDC04_04000 [Saprospiraceae bacterium]|nr:hypothetical protein [Saprospiraceae bacterium]MCB9309273.1 hypothetical protein [Lewinellaceae bacterium]
MNNSIITTNIVRIIVLLLAQVWIFNSMSFNIGVNIDVHFIIYPLAILALPVRVPTALVLIIAFFIGLFIDVFDNSLGVHAGASVLMAYIRNLSFAIVEPFDGYNVNDVPNIKRFGFAWFISYISINLFIHILAYFSFEVFTYIYILDILLNTITSFFVSLIVIFLIQFIFTTKY